MSKVRTSPYRQTPTPEGLKAIEKGTLDYFDTEMYANFNTEVLEEYLEEKNRRDGFGSTTWKWNQMMLGLIIGIIFAIINQYVGLKVGMIVSGSWYVAYLAAMALRWSPGEVNLSASASTGASMVCTGFVFTYPAIYLLAYSAKYEMNGTYLVDSSLLLPNSWALAGVAMVASILGGFLGCLYFIIFRRVWLVEDPLPLPGFEANIKLMDIAGETAKEGGMEGAMHSIRLVGISTAIIMAFTFLRDWPLLGTGTSDAAGKEVKTSILSRATENISWYDGGDLTVPMENSLTNYTWLGFGLYPMMIAIGWFMRFRVALLVSLGTFFTWFVVTPLAFHYDYPFYLPIDGNYHSVSQFSPMGSLVSYGYVARPMAIGAILGGGITGLLKMAPVFKTTASDVIDIFRGESDNASRKDYVEGKGWYEWPISHIPVMLLVSLIGITLTFSTQFGFFPSLIFSLILCLTTFALGAIAVKVMGETSIEPVSGTSFIVLLMLVVIFKGIGLSESDTAILALVGTTVFGGAISMSGTVIGDYKPGLYVGNRPMHIMKTELLGIIPGTIVAALFAGILSLALARGDLVLYAPQANAFAAFAQIMLGGQTPWNLLLLGIVIGVFMELITGMGTAFGLGMYLPMVVTLPMVIGGGLRDYWESRFLDVAVEKENLSEKQRTMRLLNTYMIATGCIVGEALLGTLLAIYYVLPLLTG
ncbi:MAG: OPT/YSL family transporter [Candidatus Poseidoniia archaeon]|nr:OPT/YSL family transporter [Candidatus Poseidoniia archaeon]